MWPFPNARVPGSGRRAPFGTSRFRNSAGPLAPEAIYFNNLSTSRHACASESASNVGGDSSSAGTEDARKLRAAPVAISTRKRQPAYGFEGLRVLPAVSSMRRCG
jgi:hypothetical protein